MWIPFLIMIGIVLSGCDASPRNQTPPGQPADSAGIRGDADKTAARAPSNPLTEAVHQGQAAMQDAKAVTDKVNTRIVEQGHSAEKLEH